VSEKQSPFLKINIVEGKEYYTLKTELLVNLHNIHSIEKQMIEHQNNNLKKGYRYLAQIKNSKDKLLINEETYNLLKNYIDKTVGIIDIEMEAQSE
jgi:hypothetical protein